MKLEALLDKDVKCVYDTGRGVHRVIHGRVAGVEKELIFVVSVGEPSLGISRWRIVTIQEASE